MFKVSLKKLLKHPLTQKTIAWFLAQYMWFVFKTSRWQFIRRDVFEYYWKNKKPLIVCFWHNRLAMLTFAWQDKSPFYMLISGHADGRIIAYSVGFHGIKIIDGSSSKGSSTALRQLMKLLKENYAVGVTPDGPRGPRFSVKSNLIQLAQKAKADIVPLTYSTSRRKVIGSWDRLIIPLPFSKGVFICGEPLKVADLPIDKAAALLRQNLIKISDEADQLCGQESIPAPQTSKRQKNVS